MNIETLKDHWEVIRDEALALDRSVESIAPIDPQGKDHSMIAAEMVKGSPGWINSGGRSLDKWLHWGLCYIDEFLTTDVRMPKTMELLRKLGNIKTAAVSLFRPGTLLDAHHHPELKGECLSYHLGLDVPDGCCLGIGGELLKEENGKPIIFDGSKWHYAYNWSDRDRLILYCEFRV